MPRTLTDEQVGVIEHMANGRNTPGEIAARAGCSVQAVRDKCHRNGWSLLDGRIRNGGRGTPGAEWTAERVVTLEALWKKGHSASQIARHLGGVTRNAVISKVHRIGLTGDDKPRRSVQSRAKSRKVMSPKLKPKFLLKPKPEPDAMNIPMVKIRRKRRMNGRYCKIATFPLTDHTCKWPVRGTGADTRFCGHASEHDSSYCHHHKKRSVSVYIPRDPEAEMRRIAAVRRATAKRMASGVNMRILQDEEVA